MQSGRGGRFRNVQGKLSVERLLLVTPPFKPRDGHGGIALVKAPVTRHATVACVTALYPSLQLVLDFLAHVAIGRFDNGTGSNC